MINSNDVTSLIISLLAKENNMTSYYFTNKYEYNGMTSYCFKAKSKIIIVTRSTEHNQGGLAPRMQHRYSAKQSPSDSFVGEYRVILHAVVQIIQTRIANDACVEIKEYRVGILASNPPWNTIITDQIKMLQNS
ncbi:unnamed protein product [Owenia fusiformis]|uniref:Uncharacterized protein n=1 Tax=Owenia fusiformis TaxID=6347 RepID=A0A8J1U1G2_OWEFU|nr:unnamed protein product [Owenia fusiformis]